MKVYTGSDGCNSCKKLDIDGTCKNPSCDYYGKRRRDRKSCYQWQLNKDYQEDNHEISIRDN